MSLSWRQWRHGHPGETQSRYTYLHRLSGGFTWGDGNQHPSFVCSSCAGRVSVHSTRDYTQPQRGCASSCSMLFQAKDAFIHLNFIHSFHTSTIHCHSIEISFHTSSNRLRTSKTNTLYTQLIIRWKYDWYTSSIECRDKCALAKITRNTYDHQYHRHIIHRGI